MTPQFAFAPAVGMLWLSVLLGGCVGTRPVSEAPPPIVPIADLKAVVGTWHGMITREPFQRDWLELTIREDGSFQYVSHRGYIGIARGEGQMTLENGRLRSQTERGSATYSLAKRNDQPVMLVNVITKKGLRYTAELTRAE